MDYRSSWEFNVGLLLAISSNLFIGASFIIKKKALLKLQKYGVRAGEGGHGYLRQFTWWSGLLTMGIGEAANFVAYAFAPASVVTSLGALSIVVTAILSSKYLNEKINLLGKLGCILCMLGTTIIVINAPKDEQFETFQELIEKLYNKNFIIYIIIIITINLYLIFYCVPVTTTGHNNIIIYIFICSSFGSLTVVSCKGLGRAILDSIYYEVNEMENWITWLFLLSIIVCIMIQMNYLNKALDLFNTAVVTPIYYVGFTSFVIIATSIIFEEWKHMNLQNIVCNFCGFLVIITAIFLLNAFKDLNITYRDIKQLSITNNIRRDYSSNGKNIDNDNNVFELLLNTCNYASSCTCCIKCTKEKENVI
ncbi:magnesium transporter NIPA2 [Microplitis demolitor]|uniref:magnesium transporter NIPA2 n=1 Tax=Microplitis demolitor TaxID=69319 RepID=UPI0004CCE3E2|nr:magnesium transporter NIPA2 [Microplitis demolitor]